ncbi:MAG: hypothetical protein LIO90_07330 [Bacteroidales bacterium]|nr:hypothetical protein [Bacteroidales bacterium]
MGTLYLFNPQNDLALAENSTHYNPSQKVAELIRQQAWLPREWAQPSDSILVDGKICPVDPSEPSVVVSRVEPWGWSRDAKRQFLQAGVDEALLPSDSWLAAHRQLSHRRTSISLLQALGYPTELIPVEATSAAQAYGALQRWGGDGFLKLPWSGSGRGVFRVAEMGAERVERYIQGMIRRQGSVIVEPAYNRQADFAALFYHGMFRGLSLFVTDHNHVYQRNVEIPQRAIIHRLGVDPMPIISEVEKVLAHLITPTYQGWMGVDMLTYLPPSGELKIAPCIEVNLRMTMGVATLLRIQRRCKG